MSHHNDLEKCKKCGNYFNPTFSPHNSYCKDCCDYTKTLQCMICGRFDILTKEKTYCRSCADFFRVSKEETIKEIEEKSMTREVKERDLRDPKYADGEASDYEFRNDGSIVRKNRWEMGIREVAAKLGIAARDSFEIEDIVEGVVKLQEENKMLSKRLARYFCGE